MPLALAFTRILFFVLSMFFMMTYMASQTTGSLSVKLSIGALIGFLLGCCLMGFDILFRRYNLRSFNIAVLGIFIGYLMGEALILVFEGILSISKTLTLSPQMVEMIKISIYLFGVYLGTIMTLKSSEELYVSIPFIRFTPQMQKKRDLLIDISALDDPRIVDLAVSGLVDNHLIIPRFVLKEIYSQIETGDENIKEKAKRCLETVKKLEDLPELQLRFHDVDFPESPELSGKFVRLSRLLEANVLSSSLTEVQIPSLEGIKIINLNNLSHALKPLSEAGEKIKIKIQRYGKEPRQGVGYMDDGTMVVVNGGGDYVGKMIEVQVLSVKHTTAGRIIFCNTIEESARCE